MVYYDITESGIKAKVMTCFCWALWATWFECLFHQSIAPSGFDRIVVLERGSRYITISWDRPAATNGILVNYTILQAGDVIAATPPSVLQYSVSPLLPFTTYSFSVMACTSVGCVESQERETITMEDGEYAYVHKRDWVRDGKRRKKTRGKESVWESSDVAGGGGLGGLETPYIALGSILY